MPNDLDYRQKISTYQLSDLIDLWQAIERRDTPDWEPGKAFEYLILRAFELEEAEVRWPYSVRIGEDEIEQIDGAIYADGLACLVETKDQNKKVNFEPIAKLRSQLLRRPAATIGLIFSYSGFTASALTLAPFTAPQTILLWSGEEVAFALENNFLRRGLIAKYRMAIERCLPQYNIRVGVIE